MGIQSFVQVVSTLRCDMVESHTSLFTTFGYIKEAILVTLTIPLHLSIGMQSRPILHPLRPRDPMVWWNVVIISAGWPLNVYYPFIVFSRQLLSRQMVLINLLSFHCLARQLVNQRSLLSLHYYITYLSSLIFLSLISTLLFIFILSFFHPSYIPYFFHYIHFIWHIFIHSSYTLLILMLLSFTYYFLCLTLLFSCMRFVSCYFFVYLCPTFFIHTSF